MTAATAALPPLIGADAQRAINDCRAQAVLRRELWQVLCDHGRFHAKPRSYDVNEDAVVGRAGSDGDFYVSPGWQETARAEGWK